MNPAYSICVAQTCPVRGDLEANLREHLSLIRLAASRGARLILFPELSLTGYELDLAEKVALSEGDARLDPLIHAAASHAMTIVAGAPLRLGARLHIGALIADPSGGVSIYTKRRLGAFGESARRDGTLPPAESTVFHPGSLDPLVRFADGAAAIAICADIGDPSHARRAADREAATYLASMFVIPSEFEGDSERLRGYAAGHSLVVGFANFGAPTGGLAAAGRSSIWSERGELLIRLPPRGAGVAIAARSSEGWKAESAMLAGP